MTVNPRYRWTGAGQALDEVCSLTGIHDVGLEAFALWAATLRDLRASGPKTTAPGTEDPIHTIAVETFGIGGGQDPANGHDLGESHHIGESGATCSGVAQKENAQHRRQAAGWLASNAFAHWVVCRQTLVLLQRLQKRKFVQAGAAWETK